MVYFKKKKRIGNAHGRTSDGSEKIGRPPCPRALQRASHPRERAPHQSLSFHLISSQITQIIASCFLQPGSGARGGQALLPAARRWSRRQHGSPLPAATGGRLPRRQQHAAEERARGGA
jgi:hypothetical protein